MKRHSHRKVLGAVALAMVLTLAASALAGCGLYSRSDDTESAESSLDTEAVPLKEAGTPGVAEIEVAEVPGDDEAVSEYRGSAEDASTVPPEDRLVIRTTGIRLRVDDVAEAAKTVRDLTSEFDGIITVLQVSTDDDAPVYDYDTSGPLSDGEPLSGYITVRIPADSLEDFTERVVALGTVLQQSAEESDVTQAHIDLTARLKNLQAQEARLRQFFDAAKTVEEMLSIEDALGRVRGEIEAMQAQIAYLERQAAMATVTIQLARPEPLVSSEEETSGFRDALKDGIAAAADLVQYILVIVIATSPIWVAAILVVGVILGIRAILGRRGPRKEDGGPRDSSQSQ
ncbi:MAG: DUF4349 domain-containing protein [Coriobacteriia bacterium]|nr:DUF4349 domain-containing protein [Coriobacteriia bacterium]